MIPCDVVWALISTSVNQKPYDMSQRQIPIDRKVQILFSKYKTPLESGMNRCWDWQIKAWKIALTGERVKFAHVLNPA